MTVAARIELVPSRDGQAAVPALDCIEAVAPALAIAFSPRLSGPTASAFPSDGSLDCSVVDMR